MIVVLDYKVTKFEWDTQLVVQLIPLRRRCFGLQSYKIWVIYTTIESEATVEAMLFWITKLQNLSDIHNRLPLDHVRQGVVLDYKVTKFEWYTQRTSALKIGAYVVLDYKVTKFEWYTQLAFVAWHYSRGCFGLQSYKIWVIYTTVEINFAPKVLLFWITKLQNLSDIHNSAPLLIVGLFVVLDYKVTKFEWYTQRSANSLAVASSCFGLQSYKIWVIYVMLREWLLEKCSKVIFCR